MEQNTDKDPNGKRKKSSDNKIEWRRATGLLPILLLAVLGLIVLSQLFEHRAAEADIPYNRFEDEVKTGNVRAGTIIGQSLHGIYSDGRRFHTTLPPNLDATLVDRWRQSGMALEFKIKRPDLGTYLLGLLPWILMIAFFFFILRRMQGGGMGPKGLFSFGKSKAKLQSDTKSKITFANVAGADEAKEELRRDYRVPAQSAQVRAPRRPDSARLPVAGPSGNGQNAARKGCRG